MKNDDPNTENEKEATGNSTEIALLRLIHKAGIQYPQLREKHLGTEYTRFHFNSRRKKMSTILHAISDETNERLHVKGASEIVLRDCTHIRTSNGVESIDAYIDTIDDYIKKYAGDALRTIILAYRDLEKGTGGIEHTDQDSFGNNVVESNLTFIAMIGIRDTLRTKVKEAVKDCKKAQITVRMVTGDNKLTAKAIAKECGILNSEEQIVMEGKEFSELLGGLITICSKCMKENCECKKQEETKKIERVQNIQKFAEIVDRLVVLARSRPEDKYLLVSALKEVGNIVAVTGDGTNDAPALKKADVGFAMGIAGTDVAKEAADIILLDDNFASIVQAVKWGRNIYDNIRRFLQFQLSVNIVALVVAFTGACIINESPLTPIQLLWVNLIMDSLASLALATEPPTEALLLRAPYRKDEYIISRKMMKHMIGQAIYQITILLVILFAGQNFIPEDEDYECDDLPDYDMAPDGNIRTGRRYTYKGEEEDGPITDLYTKELKDKCGPSRHFTVVFTVFVFLQLFNELNCRKINDEANIFIGILKNPMFLAIWFGTFFVQIILSIVSGRAFNCCSEIPGLTAAQFGISLVFSIGGLFVRPILLLIPDKFCLQLGKEERDPTEKTTTALSIKKKHDESFKAGQSLGSLRASGSAKGERGSRKENF